jgi:hypothetical protein
MNNLQLADVALQWQDMFGQPMQVGANQTPLYYPSQMNPVRQCALALGVRDINPEDRLFYNSTTEVNPMAIFSHVIEIAETFATLHDTLRESSGLPEDLFNGNLIGNATVDRSLTFHQDQVDFITKLVGCPGFIYTRSIRSNITYALRQSVETSIERLTFDKIWEGSQFYECASTDIYRKNCPELTNATVYGLFLQAAAIDPALLAMNSVKQVDKDFSLWLQPNIEYTQARDPGSRTMDVVLYEKDTLHAYTCFTTQIMDSASRWFQAYQGTTAQFILYNQTVDYGNQFWITDYTVQPSYGPLYGRDLLIGMTGGAQTTLGNQDVPAFESFKAVSVPLPTFNAPTVVGSFSKYDEVIKTLEGQTKS